MFGLNLFHLSPQSAEVVEAAPFVLTALILFSLVLFWRLIRSCLEDGKCRPMVKAGQGALEGLQNNMSETERDRKLGAQKRKSMLKKKGLSEDLGSKEMRDEGKDALGERQKVGKRSLEKKKHLYPIKDLEALGLGSSEDDELGSAEEEELEEEVACYEEERFHSDEVRLSSRQNKRCNKGKKGSHSFDQPMGPSAPPSCVKGSGSDSFLPREERKKIWQTFPVFETDGERVHAPVEYNQIKELAESVRNYGINANFTVSQVERLANSALTPGDWQTVIKAALPNMGQYLEWKALWHDFSQTQAKVNATAEGNQRLWTFDLLTGQGQYADNQTNYNWGAYAQISAAAVKAWKTLPKKGEAGGHLTKIIQGPQEPFSDFVARMTDAAGRIFGDPEQALPLIERLVYEQATQECRAAIAPRKSKGLQDWLKTCREIGGPLTNAGLAAAILQGQKRPGMDNRKIYYNCGEPGHYRTCFTGCPITTY